MARFDTHQRVTVKDGTDRLPARVTGRVGSAYNVLTDTHRFLKGVHYSKLAALDTEYVLFMEGNLVEGVAAYQQGRDRRTAHYLAEFVRTLGYVPLVERVHSRESLGHFLRTVGKKAKYIHISSHGVRDPEIGQALSLTHDQIILAIEVMGGKPETILRNYRAADARRLQADSDFFHSTFRGALEGKLLILSACDLGRPNGIAQLISKVSEASAVIAYGGQVSDDDVMIAETLLYRKLEDASKKNGADAVVTKVRVSLETIGIRIPLVAWRHGEQIA